ncbi:hypothetical protein J1N35_044634 [Gossypium stocksii]|uniref:Uncharacterized protein n=1 Tax=Gossypium stocksii TaxID=47602 RepID=A0A9D3U9S2_9ROSI|nr:hypothetical protein J1N35_044634 [Gossypium stocksii]
MVPKDTYIPPAMWGGNYYTARRSNPTKAAYKWRSSDRAWKSTQSVGHLQAVTWKSAPPTMRKED